MRWPKIYEYHMSHLLIISCGPYGSLTFCFYINYLYFFPLCLYGLYIWCRKKNTKVQLNTFLHISPIKRVSLKKRINRSFTSRFPSPRTVYMVKGIFFTLQYFISEFRSRVNLLQHKMRWPIEKPVSQSWQMGGNALLIYCVRRVSRVQFIRTRLRTISSRRVERL